MGVNNGGVWKTDDYGRTWLPIFDKMPTGSIGDIAVSPTNSHIIYVGTGEGLHRPDLSVGNGIYKTEDGGTTWNHLGLKDIQQVGRIIVHPTNPMEVFVAGLGHPYGANEERTVGKHGKRCYSLMKIQEPFKLNIIQLIQKFFLPAYGSIEKVHGKMVVFQEPTAVFLNLSMVAIHGNLSSKDYLQLSME
jgi:hypothetical protein